MSFQNAMKRLWAIEGGYVNDKNDSGGETNWGITKALARSSGYDGDMKDMTKETAESIYRTHFWLDSNIYKIDEHSQAIAEQLFIIAVHMGARGAVMLLQRMLNALGADLQQDGLLGKATVKALQDFLGKRGPDGVGVLLKGLQALYIAYLIGLAERRLKDRAFVYGWIKART